MDLFAPKIWLEHQNIAIGGTSEPYVQGNGRECGMYDERDLRKVIPLLGQDREEAIKRSLSEIYNAIYLLNLATDLEGIGVQDAEIEDTMDQLRRDLVSVMRQIHGYAEEASRAFLELVKKHRLDDSASGR